MKTFALLLSLLALNVFADGNVQPNGATPIAVVSNQAASFCVENPVAAGSASVATVPAQSGLYFYVTNISVALNAIAAPVATLMPTTSTNLPGAFSIRMAVQAAVGNFLWTEAFSVPLKSSVVGTATVLTGTALANVSQNIRVCGFYAP